MRNTKGATSRAGTTYPSRTPEFTPVFNDVRVAQSNFCEMLCGLFFVLSSFPFAHCSVYPRLTGSAYPLCIFKLF